jgi:hypothetical protein
MRSVALFLLFKLSNANERVDLNPAAHAEKAPVESDTIFDEGYLTISESMLLIRETSAAS